MSAWLVDKSALVRLGRTADAEEWLGRLIADVTGQQQLRLDL